MHKQNNIAALGMARHLEKGTPEHQAWFRNSVGSWPGVACASRGGPQGLAEDTTHLQHILHDNDWLYCDWYLEVRLCRLCKWRRKAGRKPKFA